MNFFIEKSKKSKIVFSQITLIIFKGSTQKLTKRHSTNHTQQKRNYYNKCLDGKYSAMSISELGADFDPIFEDTTKQINSLSLIASVNSNGCAESTSSTTRPSFKVILAGSSGIKKNFLLNHISKKNCLGVGKTSIIMNYKFNRTQEHLYQPTISSNYVSFKL